MYHPSLPGDIEAKRTGSTHIYSVPFLYIVPDGTEFPDDNEFPTSCRPLPPSTTGTFFYTNTWNALLQPHVNIQYFIKAIVTYSQRTPTTSSATTTAVVTRPIDLLPYNDVPPPVNIHSYPGEFTETIQRPIRASYIGEQLGSVTAKAGEPPPLTYMAGVKEVSTDCILRISIQGAKIDPRRLGHITVEVYPILHAKTYFSLQQMQCMPSRCSIADDGPQLYETLMRLNIQKFRDFQWSSSVPIPRDQAHIEQQTSTAPAVDGTSHGRQPADTSRKCFQSRFTLPWVQMEALPSEQRVTTWQTTVRVPIYPPQRLHPSFCSTLAARSYSIELQIRIYGGLYTGKMRLEVPLQVAYPRPSAARPGDAPFQFAPDDLELGNSDTDNGTSRMRVSSHKVCSLTQLLMPASRYRPTTRSRVDQPSHHKQSLLDTAATLSALATPQENAPSATRMFRVEGQTNGDHPVRRGKRAWQMRYLDGRMSSQRPNALRQDLKCKTRRTGMT